MFSYRFSFGLSVALLLCSGVCLFGRAVLSVTTYMCPLCNITWICLLLSYVVRHMKETHEFMLSFRFLEAGGELIRPKWRCYLSLIR